MIICGGLIFVSSFAFTEAIYVTNYPIVMMFKSCNVLSVITVGIFCSRVKEKKNRLSNKKLISGFVITIGILIYNLCGPQEHV